MPLFLFALLLDGGSTLKAEMERKTCANKEVIRKNEAVEGRQLIGQEA